MPCKEIWVGNLKAKVKGANSEVVEEFDAHLKRTGSSNHTRYIYMRALELLDKSLKKPYRQATGKDIDRFIDHMNDALQMSDMTRRLYVGKLQVFYRWHMGDGKKTPDFMAERSVKAKRKAKTSADMLTPEDIKRLLDACANPRDAAIISLLAETGIRRSELVGLKIKHVQFQPEGYALVQVPDPSDAAVQSAAAKTGSYTAYAEQSIPYLRHWLNEHPEKGNREAALFVGVGDGRAGQPLESQGLYLIVKRIARTARIGKPVYPHIFRHSSATMWAKEGYTAEQINLRQGRRQDSRVAQTYINLDNNAVIEQIKRRRGFSCEQEKTEALELGVKVCWKCGETNPEANLFCYVASCRAPLKGSERFEEITKALDVYHAIKSIHSDPDLRGDLEWLVRRKERKEKAGNVL